MPKLRLIVPIRVRSLRSSRSAGRLPPYELYSETASLRLKEDLLRLNARLFGHRYLMDMVVPGGVARDLARTEAEDLVQHLEALRREVTTLQSIY